MSGSCLLPPIEPHPSLGGPCHPATASAKQRQIWVREEGAIQATRIKTRPQQMRGGSAQAGWMRVCILPLFKFTFPRPVKSQGWELSWAKRGPAGWVFLCLERSGCNDAQLDSPWQRSYFTRSMGVLFLPESRKGTRNGVSRLAPKSSMNQPSVRAQASENRHVLSLVLQGGSQHRPPFIVAPFSFHRLESWLL